MARLRESSEPHSCWSRSGPQLTDALCPARAPLTLEQMVEEIEHTVEGMDCPPRQQPVWTTMRYLRVPLKLPAYVKTPSLSAQRP